MRAVAYLRVSTDRQADEGLGLDVQLDAVTAWCRRERHSLAHVCQDRGRSGGADVVDRPGLAEALGHLQAGRAQLLIVARLDRLARGLVLQEWLRAEIIRAGGELRSTSAAEDLHLREDPDDPTGQLVRHILGAIAEYERSMIRLRMQAGKARKRDAGGYAAGAPPYGYAARSGALVPIAAEQDALRRMKRWRRDGQSYRQIADRLNAAGVATRRGQQWFPGVVREIILRDTPGGRRPHAGQSAEIAIRLPGNTTSDRQTGIGGGAGEIGGA